MVTNDKSLRIGRADGIAGRLAAGIFQKPEHQIDRRQPTHPSPVALALSRIEKGGRIAAVNR